MTPQDEWIRTCFRCLREQHRDCVRMWVKKEYVLMDRELEQIEKTIHAFRNYMKEKRAVWPK